MWMRVVRDPAVAEGSERREVDPFGVIWRVSPHGVSEQGARAFEAAWKWLVAHGVDSDELSVQAEIDPEPRQGVPIRFHYAGGILTFWCHPADFSWATVNGACVEHREKVSRTLDATSARSA